MLCCCNDFIDQPVGDEDNLENDKAMTIHFERKVSRDKVLEVTQFSYPHLNHWPLAPIFPAINMFEMDFFAILLIPGVL